jgi:hypothetical protein
MVNHMMEVQVMVLIQISTIPITNTEVDSRIRAFEVRISESHC